MRFCDDGRIESIIMRRTSVGVVALGRKNFFLRAPMVVEECRSDFVCSVGKLTESISKVIRTCCPHRVSSDRARELLRGRSPQSKLQQRRHTRTAAARPPTFRAAYIEDIENGGSLSTTSEPQKGNSFCQSHDPQRSFCRLYRFRCGVITETHQRFHVRVRNERP